PLSISSWSSGVPGRPTPSMHARNAAPEPADGEAIRSDAEGAGRDGAGRLVAAAPPAPSARLRHRPRRLRGPLPCPAPTASLHAPPDTPPPPHSQAGPHPPRLPPRLRL